ncbi:hypothetical protein Q3G72_006484 [Acer saccharum]|nr:hypothetical protein Q3G72_006484 [Acer saccharum]
MAAEISLAKTIAPSFANEIARDPVPHLALETVTPFNDLLPSLETRVIEVLPHNFFVSATDFLCLDILQKKTDKEKQNINVVVTVVDSASVLVSISEEKETESRGVM